MDKQKADALVIDEATSGEDIDDYIDENNFREVVTGFKSELRILPNI